MADLPKLTLGRSGLEVTTLGFGAMELSGLDRDVSDKDAERLLNAVLDAGINFIDTSIDYGRSEERIGRFISHRRSEFFLASKCGCVPGGTGHIHTAENIRAGVENSLRILNTDYLDLVQFHRSLTKREFEEHGALGEALKLKEEGKVRFVGVSGTLPNLIEQIEMGVFDAFQIPYSALQREHEEAIARASAANGGIIIRGGIARGAPSDWKGRPYYMVPGTEMKDHWEKGRLDEILDGMSHVEFMLRFALSNPDLDTTIVGTKDISHLKENVEFALKGPLPPDVLEEAKRRLPIARSTPLVERLRAAAKRRLPIARPLVRRLRSLWSRKG